MGPSYGLHPFFKMDPAFRDGEGNESHSQTSLTAKELLTLFESDFSEVAVARL